MVALFATQSNILELPQKSNEWYTPARYIEAAREVMGFIDLDPASCELANKTVKAKKFYTKYENGLEQSWYGKVWLNPPYGSTNGKSNIGRFVRKLVEEYNAGNITEAILLSTARIDTSWFNFYWDYLICFSDHCIQFHRPNQSKKQHIHGTIFVYFGTNEQCFIDIFSQFGTVARRVSAPKIAPVNLDLWKD